MSQLHVETDSDDDICVPKIVLDEAAQAVSNLLPEKSRLTYEREYTVFCKWRALKNVKAVTEEVLLAYFSEKSKTVKISTMWSHYSMLKATLSAKENIDISKFSKLIALLKRQTAGYKPKKSRIFERDDINKFFAEATDEQYLLMKVVAIMGIAGGCRIDELHKIKVDHISDRGTVLVVNIPDAKTKRERTFTIVSEGWGGVNPLEIYRKYASLRPSNVSHNKFFICYRAQKCTVQPVGINTLTKVPKMIAQYLKLENPESYTGRTLASLLANAGADLLTLKRHGGWKSSSAVEGYIDESVNNKIATSKKIFVGLESNEAAGSSGLKATMIRSEEIRVPSIHLNHVKSSTINIYVNSETNKC